MAAEKEQVCSIWNNLPQEVWKNKPSDSSSVNYFEVEIHSFFFLINSREKQSYDLYLGEEKLLSLLLLLISDTEHSACIGHRNFSTVSVVMRCHVMLLGTQEVAQPGRGIS